MTDTELAAMAGITVLPMSRDVSVWGMLDRSSDKFDNKTGAMVKPGEPKGHRDNVQMILAHDPWWADALAYNTLSERVEWTQRDGTLLVVEDHHEAEVGLMLARQYGIHANTKIVSEAVSWAAHRHTYSPVADFLTALEWDGVERISSWCSRYLGAPDDRVTQAMGRAWLIQAVARAMQPGCKADTVLIMRGPQGSGKSTSLSILGGDWFRDTPIDLASKDRFSALQGAWIYELAELDSLRRAEAQTLKAFVSSQRDSYRPSYGRNTRDVPRTTVFAGTTNDDEFLQDATGSRRWWVIETTACDAPALREDRDQLWAEAVHVYREGESWHLEQDLEADRAIVAQQYEVSDPLAAPFEIWCDKLHDYTIAEAWSALGHLNPPAPRDGQRVGKLIQRLGTHEKAKVARNGKRVNGYRLIG
jgi:putative DNA primase/helicase